MAPGISNASRLAMLHDRCSCTRLYGLVGRLPRRDVETLSPVELQFYGDDTLADMRIRVCPRCRYGYRVETEPRPPRAPVDRWLRRILWVCMAIALSCWLIAAVGAVAQAADCVGPDDPPGCVTPSPTPTVTVTETAPPAEPTGPTDVNVTGISDGALGFVTFVAALSAATGAAVMVAQVRR
jgi:hypothetical protein